MDGWLPTELDISPLAITPPPGGNDWAARDRPTPIPAPATRRDQTDRDPKILERGPMTPSALSSLDQPDLVLLLAAVHLDQVRSLLAILQDRLVAAIARQDQHRQWLADYRVQDYAPTLITATETALRASERHIKAIQRQIGRLQRTIISREAEQRQAEAALRDSALIDFDSAGKCPEPRGYAATCDQPLATAPGVAPNSAPQEPTILPAVLFRQESRREFGADAAGNEARALHQDGDPRMTTLRRLTDLADTQRIYGRLTQAATFYHQAIALASVPGNDCAAVASYSAVGLGDVLYEQNDLAGAAECLAQAVTFCEWAAGSVTPAAAYAGLARVKQATHETGEAGALFAQAMRLPVAAAPGRWESWTAGQAARLALVFGDVGRAAGWADHAGLQATDRPAADREDDYLTLARLLLARGEAASALALLIRLREEAGAGGRIGRLIEIQVLQALARGTQGDGVGATVSLADALALAEPEGYIRVFVDAGTGLTPWLRQAAEHGIAPEYAGCLLALIDGAPEGYPATPPGGVILGLVEALSEREQEILHLLAAGLSNAEMAIHLVLALPTVKRHLNNLYGKLGAKSRTQALARARALQLL
jgi:DNA-binding CsgD family transcriptional regulator